uniref:Uncharacterized protein n=1 Tax=Pithovirus LCDPAC02 TaxID=2506601 RepID=A0A481YNI1_9VIRU|nr:MAG: hypothetical protein LCDPAC02_00510 [Pithovirus LCDPAC02]
MELLDIISYLHDVVRITISDFNLTIDIKCNYRCEYSIILTKNIISNIEITLLNIKQNIYNIKYIKYEKLRRKIINLEFKYKNELIQIYENMKYKLDIGLDENFYCFKSKNIKYNNF